MISTYKVNNLMLMSVLVLVMLETSLAIKCWDCNSYTDRNCGHPFDNRTLSVTDCSQIADRNKQKCRKIIQKINGVLKYTRGCLIDDHNSNQLSEASIELCSTDGCNSAPVQIPVSLTVLILPILFGFCLLR